MPAADLFIVATPIGNLEDMTQRAIGVLAAADIVVAEDTRRSGALLRHFGIERPLLALHDHNESSVAPGLVERLLAGESVALLSDAGTPLISDPGFRLVRLAIAAGVPVRPVPGASAVTAALSVAGLPTDRYAFEGFLPARQTARLAALQKLSAEPRTLVFFESSHRVQESVADMASVFGPAREAALCRELTKRFETVLRGSLGTLVRTLEEQPDQRRGEFVLVVAGAEADADSQMARALQLARALQEYVSVSQSARIAARLCGVPRRQVYDRLESAPGAD